MNVADRPSHPPQTRRWARRVLWATGIVLLVCASAVAASVQIYRSIGRTPPELLDYVDRRLEGHPKLEWLAHPFLTYLRTEFEAIPVRQRSRLPFLVPAPPPRRGPAEVLPSKAPPPTARVWRVSPGGAIGSIAAAAKLAKSGDVVEIEAGDYRRDVAVWNQKKLIIRGVNGAARIHADGAIAEGKAIWVIRNGDFEIENIDFIGAKAGDGNGAGIRFEGGSLRIRHCLFWGNQMGLLTSNGDHAKNSTLVVENSEFGYSNVANRWGHNLYVGTIDSLSVVGSYFHHAGVGHLLKSRARRTEILYSRLTDEAGGRASYEVELPNGGEVLLLGNIIQQQASTENSIMVSYGAEGYRWPVNALTMSSNTIVNDHPHGGTFLRVTPGADRVLSVNTLLVGHGGYKVADPLTTINDRHADWSDLHMPTRLDYRLQRPGDYTAQPGPATVDGSLGVTPSAQYVHPMKVVPLNAPPSVVGADQRPSR